MAALLDWQRLREYRLIISDVWGVIHNGQQLYPGIVELFDKLAAADIPVMLLSNAPRRNYVVEAGLQQMGLAAHLYAGILTSGEAVHGILSRRSDEFGFALGRAFTHLGPPRDRSCFEGLDYHEVDVAAADFVLCTGLLPGHADPAAARPLLEAARQRDLPLICANPDRVVMVGAEMHYCAGAVADIYQAMGGRVSWVGKPHRLVYEKLADSVALNLNEQVLAVGDSCETDLRGANAAAIHSLFITGGIHRADIATPSDIPRLLAQHGCVTNYVLPSFAAAL